MSNLNCPPEAPLYGYMGVVCAMVLSGAGAIYGGVKSLESHRAQGSRVVGTVLSVILGLIGMVMALTLLGTITLPEGDTIVFSLVTGFSQLTGGLCCGLSNLTAGMAIGLIMQKSKQGDHGRDWSLLGQTDSPDGMVGHTMTCNKDPETNGYSAMTLAFVFGLVGSLVALFISQNVYMCAD